jgi:hypothetical protein
VPWARQGSRPQTAARNAAELLADGGRVEAALTILSVADTDPEAPTLAPDSAARLGRRMHELRAQLGAEAARVVQAGSRRPRTEIVASALDALADD